MINVCFMYYEYCCCIFSIHVAWFNINKQIKPILYVPLLGVDLNINKIFKIITIRSIIYEIAYFSCFFLQNEVSTIYDLI